MFREARDYSIFLAGLVVWLLGNLADVITSMIPAQGLRESNLYLMTLDGEYDPLKGILVKGAAAAMVFLLFALPILFGTRDKGRLVNTLGQGVAATPFVIFGYTGIEAAFNNILLLCRFNVPWS